MTLFERLERFAALAQFVYLARFSVVVLLVIAAFMPVVLYSPLNMLFGSMYDLDCFGKNFWFSLFAFLLAFTIVTTIKIVILYGGERAGFDDSDRKYLKLALEEQFINRSWLFLAAMLFALILLSGAVFAAARDFVESYDSALNVTLRIFGLFAGFFGALALLLLASLFHRSIYDPREAADLPNFLFPYSLFPFQTKWFAWLHKLRESANNAKFLSRFNQSRVVPLYRPRWLEKRLMLTPQYFGRGYLRYNAAGAVETVGDGDAQRAVFEPGHYLAATMLLFFFALYLVVGYSGVAAQQLYKLAPFLASVGKLNLNVTAVSYVMLLLTVLCWFVAALAFLFDRFRLPVVLVIVALLTIASWSSGTDHYYTTRDLDFADRHAIQTEKLAPLAVLLPSPNPNLAAAIAPPRDFLIVVAADGGGIQAAAWTARVLTGIEQLCLEKFKQPCSNRIRLISSVSGGSVGAMYFVNAYTANGLPHGANEKGEDALEKIVERAETSSLDAVAWGVAYPDFARSFVPFRLFDNGRGHALEEAWVRTDCDDAQALAKRECSLDTNLSKWREGVKAGWRPANIFNATISETGERLLIATTDICSNECECAERIKNCPNKCDCAESAQNAANQNAFAPDVRAITAGRWNFYDLMPEKDIAVSTAARLSASFPYVTPAARASSDGSTHQRLHVVDGGYYDNYGVSSLAEWLNEALMQDAGASVKNVLVVQIRGNYAPDSKEAANVAGATGKGWFYQLIAPVATMYNVRTAGQLSHNQIELGLLQRYWETRGVKIGTAIFQYEDKNPSPLSWHLTAEQKKRIKTAWEKIVDEKDRETAWKTFAAFIAEANQNEKPRS